MTLDWTGKLLERYSDDEREAVCDVLKAKYGIVTERSGKEWRSNGCTVAGDYHYEHAPTELDAVIALADWMRS